MVHRKFGNEHTRVLNAESDFLPRSWAQKVAKMKKIWDFCENIAILFLNIDFCPCCALATRLLHKTLAHTQNTNITEVSPLVCDSDTEIINMVPVDLD